MPILPMFFLLFLPMLSGSCYTYSFCTDFLGRVCEKVSGTSLELFMKKALLDPLGMHDTHFVVPVPCTNGTNGPIVPATNEISEGSMNIYIHACIHTLHYITLHYFTLHYFTLHYITYIQTDTHTYIHPCMHTYIHTHVYMGADRKCKSKNYERACLFEHPRL